MFQRARIPLLLLPAAVLGCVDGDLPTLDIGGAEEAMYSDIAGVGPFNGVEWQIDAPWRLEPAVGADGTMTYDRIPLVITMNDVADQIDQLTPGDDIMPIKRFCGLYVLDRGEGWIGSPVTYIPAEAFHEIEGERRWLSNEQQLPGPTHRIRRLWKEGEADPTPVLDISQWSGWNAVAMYTPVRQRAPGEDIRLIAMARVSQDSSCGTVPLTMTPNDIMAQLAMGRASTRTWSSGAASFFFGEFLSVHYGEAPLPRFDDGQWVYGDLHYHSQGTDNENESGVSYRGTIQAMKAMGLDFAFATEHASNSQQITQVKRWGLDDLPDIPYVPSGLEDDIKNAIIDYLNNAGLWLGSAQTEALRDMSDARFQHLYAWLNGSQGVNAEVGASGGSDRRPEIFLAGEVDVIPEMSSADKVNAGFPYGVDRWYDANEPCFGVPDAIIDYTNFEDACVGSLIVKGVYNWDIEDVQGLFLWAKARQHLVYLPRGGNAHAFIGSNTNPLGGANRWFRDVIKQELQDRQLGYMFLAHPIDAESGNGAERLGPDMVPYSDVQLQAAFEAPEVLGLQIWNSSTRGRTHAGDHQFPMLERGGHSPDPDLPDEVAYPLDSSYWDFTDYDEGPMLQALYQGAGMWDHVLLWGINPARTAGVKGCEDGEPRKMFMAGGTDAHGDLNYHRSGGLTGWSGASDNALGKVRNLIFIESGTSRPSQDEVEDAMKTGRFSVTDGPALRIAIDANGNGVIDDSDVDVGGDVNMGGDFGIDTGAQVPLLVEWKSTPEFGPIDEINLYLGVQAGSHEGLVYSPPTGAGTCASQDGQPIRDGSGFYHCPMANGYVRDDTDTLHLTPSESLTGTVQVMIDPTDFPLFDTTCVNKVITDGDPTVPDQAIMVCRIDNVQSPQRLYVRAFASTRAPEQWPMLRRYAMTNPIWMVANQIASTPTVSVNWTNCDEDSLTNTFQIVVEQGPVTGTLTRQVRIGSYPYYRWLFGDTVTAASGEAVTARARACNEYGCSPYAYATNYGPVCQPPPPPRPTVKLESAGCYYNQTKFIATVTQPSNATSVVKQYKITSSGVWKTLSSSLIYAGSGQRVYLRAKACNDYGCSDYRSTSLQGPTCSSLGGGGRVAL